tara:strand:+ start:8627 stop:10183 length:1557 start_codon:yes stop_codon:yes gene_type:complete
MAVVGEISSFSEQFNENAKIKVLDINGNVVSGATVNVDGSDYTTNSQGLTIDILLPIASHSITINSSGFKEFTDTLVITEINGIVIYEFTLSFATNWFKGIDSALSTPGNQVALAGHLFFDKKKGTTIAMGADGSLDNPYQDYEPGIGSLSGLTCVLADGVYTGFLSISDVSFTVISNTYWGATINCNGGSINTLSGSAIQLYNLIITDSAGTLGCSTFDCIVQNIRLNIESGNDCVFIDCGVRAQSVLGDASNLRRSSFFGPYLGASTVFYTGTSNGIFNFEDCHFADDCIIDVSDAVVGRELNFTNCNNIPVNSAGSPLAYNEVDSTAFNDSACLFAGNPRNFEFQLQPASPLIGAGTNDTTIGGLNLGELVNLSSPAENNNITVGPPITITNPATTGNIKTSFRQINRKSPIVTINGLPNNTDNVPDSELALSLPNRKTLEVTYREVAGGAETTKAFLYGAPMWQDNSGNATGEDDFDAYDISSTGDIITNYDLITSANVITVAEIQENFVLNDQ